MANAPNRSCSSNQPSNTAGHRHRQRPIGGNPFKPKLSEMLQRQCLWRAAAGVEPIEPLGLGIPDDSEEIAAHAVACRFDEPEHGVGRDRGVDGIGRPA